MNGQSRSGLKNPDPIIASVADFDVAGSVDCQPDP